MYPRRYFLSVFIVTLVFLQALEGRSAFARNAGEQEAARTERTQGTVAVNLGRYDEAVEHFSRAYGLTQDPALLFSLAQAYRLGGKADKALSSYSAFLRVAGTETKYRSQIERAASEIESITSFMLNHPVDERSLDKANPRTNKTDLASKAESATNVEIMPPPVSKPDPAEETKPGPVLAKVEPPRLTPKPEPTPKPAVFFSAEKVPPNESPNRPLYKRWWVWTGVVGALAVAGAATWLYTRPDNQAPGGTYGSLRVLP
jgi:hypothetical protein